MISGFLEFDWTPLKSNPQLSFSTSHPHFSFHAWNENLRSLTFVNIKSVGLDLFKFIKFCLSEILVA